jgi:hypothetical protein
MMIQRILAAAFVAAALPAAGAQFDSLDALTQDEFHGLSEDLGAAMAYKGVTPATSLGVLGFDVGVEVTDTRVQHSSAFERAGAGGLSDLVVPKLHVYKGLVHGLDLGAFIGGTTQVGATLFGADLRLAVLDDTLATPAVALRLAGTKATGLGDLAVSTAAFDVMVSKRLAFVTPYAGAGTVRIQSRAGGTQLSDETFNRGRVFGGLNLNLAVVNLAFEAEKLGGATSLSAKLGFRF